MVQSLVDVLIALIELLEAEAEALRKNAKRLGFAAAVIAVGASVATLLLLAGSALLIWSLYLALAAPLGPALSALLCGLVLWAIVAVAAVVAARWAAR